MSTFLSVANPASLLWELPARGLSVYYGLPETPRLFHYFLPRLVLQGKQVLCLDGANRFDPLLISRFARTHGRDAAEFGRRIRVARAFTCFQLTELLVRLPRLLKTFPAQLAIVTAFPDLYFDEDVRERQAMASFERALKALKQDDLLTPVSVFTDATSCRSPRRAMLQKLIARADQVLRFSRTETGLALTDETREASFLKT